MKFQNLFLALALGVSIASCGGGSFTQTSTSLRTADDTASYYLGFMYGSQLKQLKMENVNVGAIVAGINSAKEGKEQDVAREQMEKFLNNYVQELQKKIAQDNLEKGKKFLEENAKKSGVDTLSDGIQYEVITKGEGALPLETDVVKVHYHGTLLDGTVFDSSVDRGEPVEFPLNQVIPGWTKSLTHMPVGSKWRIFIPADQAYGEIGGGGAIGPNETLIFEVELLEIVKKEESK